MKRILSFAVILLTTFSIVNALSIPLRKRAVTFAECPSKSPQFNGALIVPDPPTPGKTAVAKFTITLTDGLGKGKIITDTTDAKGKSIGDGPTDEDVCELPGVTCPIAAGSTIAFETPMEIPDDVPDTYNLEYSLVDGTGKEIACSTGPVIAPKAKDDGGKAKEGGPPGPGPAAPGGPDDGDGDGPGDAKGKEDDGPPDGPGPKGPPPPPPGGDGDGDPTPP